MGFSSENSWADTCESTSVWAVVKSCERAHVSKYL